MIVTGLTEVGHLPGLAGHAMSPSWQGATKGTVPQQRWAEPITFTANKL